MLTGAPFSHLQGGFGPFSMTASKPAMQPNIQEPATDLKRCYPPSCPSPPEATKPQRLAGLVWPMVKMGSHWATWTHQVSTEPIWHGPLHAKICRASVSPSRRAKTEMIISTALPKVAFSSPATGHATKQMERLGYASYCLFWCFPLKHGTEHLCQWVS